MADSASWKRNKANGDLAEAYAKEVLEARGNKITDVSDDEAYRKIDVDFIVEDRNGNQCWLDVKYSRLMHEGRFLFGLENERMYGVYPGWAHKCQAHYIGFFCPFSKHYYIIKWGPEVVKLIEAEGNIFSFNKDIGRDTVAEITLKFFEKHNLIVMDWRNEFQF